MMKLKVVRRLTGIGIAILSGSTPFAAQAQTLTAQQILSEFNAVVINNFNSVADVEGRLVAGNIQSGATFYNNPSAQSGASTFQAVNAVTISGCNRCNVDNNGNVNYVTSNSGSYNLNGGALKKNDPAFSMSAFTTPLNSLVTTLGGLTANSSINGSDPNNFTFNINPNSQGVAIFDVAESQLSTAANLDFKGSASTIIVNVTGAAGYAFAQNFNFNDVTMTAGDLANHVIWNFENAGSLNLKLWQGAVLAPDATVTNNSPIQGSLYALNFNGQGELHDHPFQGSVSAFSVPGPVAGAGLPAFLGLLGFCLYRRRSAA